MQDTSKSNSPDAPKLSLERLCELAANEQDCDKLIELVQEINSLLAENRNRSTRVDGQE
jgi:hypothetical protein